MLQAVTFAHNDVLPAWFANALARFVGLHAAGFTVAKVDATHIQVPAGADADAAIIAVGGRFRYMEAPVGPVAHPGGAAGVYPAFVTAKADVIVNTPVPYTDNTDYTFGLRLLAPGATPTIVAGSVDFYRHVADVVWDGAQITQIQQLVPAVGPHAWLHGAGASDTITGITDAQIAAAAAISRAKLAAIARVTALPASPYDGQEVEFVVDSTNGVYWHLRYNAGSSSAHKWEVIGGGSLIAGPSGAISTASTVALWFSGGPNVSVPLAGDYEVDFGCWMSLEAGPGVNYGYCTLSKSAIANQGAGNYGSAQGGGSGQYNGGNVSTVLASLACAAADQVSLTVVTSGGGTAVSFANGWIKMRPRRVG